MGKVKGRKHRTKQERELIVKMIEGILANSKALIKDAAADLKMRPDSLDRFYKRETGRTLTQFRLSVGSNPTGNFHPEYKKAVLKTYPHAYSYRFSPQRPWIIFVEDDPTKRAQQIGKGDSPFDAWKDAYEKLGELKT